MAALLRAARASCGAASSAPRRRAFRLKPGQVGTEVHELLPAGLAPPGAVRPPLSASDAAKKLNQLAACWNTCDPQRIVALYAEGSLRF
jgi:hypothetical protein